MTGRRAAQKCYLEVGPSSKRSARCACAKVVEERPFEDTVARVIEHADFERTPADDDDPGDVRRQ
jgi:hypothetical protein